MLQLLFLMPDQMRAFHDSIDILEAEIMRAGMAVALGLDVGFADRSKMFLVQQLVYGDVSKLGLFVGESDQTITVPDEYVVPVQCL